MYHVFDLRSTLSFFLTLSVWHRNMVEQKILLASFPKYIYFPNQENEQE
jgi:hypothetical protein